MSSHNFMTGVFRKKKRTAADMVKFYHTATVPQLNILHEFAMQHLGHAPSHSWGRQPVPFRITDIVPETWNYLRQATRQPVHEFARQMTAGSDTSKKASGAGTAIVDGLAAIGKAAVKYGGKAVGFLVKHQEAIQTGFKVGKAAVDLGTSVAGILGAIDESTKKKITAVTEAVSGAVKKFEKKPAKEKKGTGWVDYETLL